MKKLDINKIEKYKKIEQSRFTTYSNNNKIF